MFRTAAFAASALLLAMPAFAQESATELPQMQVTATREPEPVDQIPASVTVVTGESLRARGASDLRTALSLVAGVEGTPGGDAGPAGAVPSLWGLREADAYLLVVDGVPWGGAFNPATPSLDLAGVERIEILRGAAPVMYGATSFVGVIHVIHYAAGQMPASASLGGGSYGSVGAGVTLGGPSSGAWQQSLVANVEKRGYAEDRTQFARYHALYRGAAKLGDANFHVDGDVSVLPEDPSGNLLLRDGGTLHTEFGEDVNFNPSGAKLDQQRYHLALGLDGKAGAAEWAVTGAVTRTLDDILRGFLRGDAFANPPDAGVGDGLQADGYSQKRGVTDAYFDAHVVQRLAPSLRVTVGVDHLYGYGSEHAINFGYCIDGAGHEFDCAGARHDDEIVSSNDERQFSGLYGQADWKASDTLDVLAGLRLNHTRETAQGQAIDNTGPTPVLAFAGSDARTHTRLSGVVGASWRAWSSDDGLLTLYADYRNSYKPLAVDFGPEAEVAVLQPETASSYEAGAKTQLLDGRFDLDTSVFQMDFRNGLTFVDNGTGAFVRANGGETRFRGFEAEGRYELARDLQLAAHYAYHDARFRRYTRDNGASADGNRVEMSPYNLAGVGLLYLPATGFNGSLLADYAGNRKLNKSNTVDAGGYTVVDASLGYRFARVGVMVNGYNLTDRRVPVAESELQETVTVTGTAGYYRMPSRTLLLSVSMPLE